MQNETTYLNAYQPPVFSVNSVFLDVDLHDDHALIKNRMQLIRQHPGVLRLNGDELTLVSIHVNDKPLKDT